MSKVWFITGAGRGMGVDIAKAALAAGHKVVATGRNTGRVAAALGTSAELLVVQLDGTKPADAPLTLKTRLTQLRTGLAASMCWSTMQQTSMPAFLKS
jgi:NAD(P)-dependent dehydrogenase (short-subunit alcohol dehydrogenase family)